VSAVANETKHQPGWFYKFPLGWSIFGAVLVTLVLATAYSSCLVILLFFRDTSAGAANASTLAVMWLLLSFTEFAIASIAQVFVYPLLFLYVLVLFRMRGNADLRFLLALTPILGLLAWYGYDRILPDYRFYTDQRPPYEHGLTLERFFSAWAFELAVVLGFWWPIRKRRLFEPAVA
jgi:hypothetical protein